ncbi:hypothetical protein GCM10020254_83110 [Streptomyces goshikiensis]
MPAPARSSGPRYLRGSTSSPSDTSTSNPTDRAAAGSSRPPCADLTALALPCPAPGTSETVPFGRLDRRLKATTYRFFGDTDATVRTAPTARLDPQDIHLVVFAPKGRPSTCLRSNARHGSP